VSERKVSGHKISQDELLRFIRDVLTAHGASDSDATGVAEGLVWANLRGVDGHGVSRLPRYLDFIARGEIDTKVTPPPIPAPSDATRNGSPRTTAPP